MTDLFALEVLHHYPALRQQSRLFPLGNHGGYSGANLWRVETSGGPFCLRAWPRLSLPPEQLRATHRLVREAHQAGLHIIPNVLETADGSTLVAHALQLWDVMSWMPGTADFHAHPSRARLEAACLALAQLHQVWRRTDSRLGPCPAIRRRLTAYREWRTLCASGWRPTPPRDDPVGPWAERAWSLLQTHIDKVPQRLALWAEKQHALQLCLCDIWHDHVLFEGERVSGLIDYGSVKIDHVAVDLARLLGSLVGDDVEMQAVGLRAYQSLRPLSAEDEALVSALDQTGVLIGMANWLRWLYHEGRQYADQQAVARRLSALVQRVEQWQ